MPENESSAKNLQISVGPDSLAALKNQTAMTSLAMISNEAQLRDREWIVFDDTLLEAARDRLRAVADVQAAGLVVDVGGLGTTLSFYERMGKMGGVHVTMDGANLGKEDTVSFDEVGVPIPIFMMNWRLYTRRLLASRRRGEALDTTQTRLAGEALAEKLEDTLFNGLPEISVDGRKIYGYTTHPDRNLTTMTASWTTTGADILSDVRYMLDGMYNDKFYGPFILYVPKAYTTILDMDYSAVKSADTFRQRLLAFNDLSDIRVADRLPDNNLLMVQLSSNVVDLAVAADLTQEPWTMEPFVTRYMIYTAMAPRIKSDQEGNCGIVHATLSA